MKMAFRNKKRSARDGYLMTEMVVAAMVLVAVISVATQLASSCYRVRMDARQYQVAVEELSNQLDRLVHVTPDQLEGVINQLEASETLSEALHEPLLSGELIDDDNGRRVVLSLSWSRPGGSPPMTMVRWLPSIAQGGDP